MTKIFLSYRRSDSADYTDRLFASLVEEFGVGQVFKDTHNIAPGQNFAEKIEAAVGESDIVLAIIGSNWISARGENGELRLSNPVDWVRLEILSVLNRAIRLVPVVLSGATMPTTDKLPAELSPFASLNAFNVPSGSFEDGVRKLIDLIQHPPQPLKPPQSNKPGILIDLSHRQNKWPRVGHSSIFNLSDAKLAGALEPFNWELRPIDQRSQLVASEMETWKGLIFAMPYHQLIEASTRREICRWVENGGNLVMLGFEMGERHHKNNLNLLAYEFGLRFNSDIVAPTGWATPEIKPYGRAVDFGIEDSSHPVLRDVKTLRLRNCCTLTTEPGTQALLTVGNKCLSVLTPASTEYSYRWLEGGNYNYQLLEGAAWLPVLAEAPRGLCGKGKVLAVGTWELFNRDYDFSLEEDNFQFIRNLLDWLTQDN